MHSYWEHLIHDPLTLKDLMVISGLMSVSIIAMILVIGSIWALIETIREENQKKENQIHFKRLADHEVSRSE